MTGVTSFRLTQTHRKTIVDNVMKNWVANNPRPDAELIDFIAEAEKELKEKGLSKQYGVTPYKRYLRIIDQFNAILKKEQPEASTIHCSCSLRIQIQLELKDGSIGTTYGYASTKQVLNILGIPFEESDSSRKVYQPPYLTSAPIADSDEQFAEMFSKYGYALKQKSEKDFAFYSPDDTAQFASLHCLPNNGSSNAFIRYPSDLEIFKQYRKISSNAAKWQKLYNTTINELTDALNQFTTSKQIMDNWPEMIPFLPALLSHPSAVLALPKARINELSERLQLNNL